MRADRRDPVIAALRRFKPTKFLARLRDGTQKPITLSTKQNRWELLSDTLEVLPWTVIEALDDKDSVLGAVESDIEDDLVDDVPVEKQVEALVKINLNCMTVAMQETRKMFADSMKAHSDMAASMLEAMRVVQESYSLAMKIQATAAATGTEDDDQVMKMLQMAMALKMGGSPAISIAPPQKAPVPPAQAKPAKAPAQKRP